MHVLGGAQSLNAVNTLRLLGHWTRIVTIPNQFSVATAWQQFDGEGWMKPSDYYDRIVDVMEGRCASRSCSDLTRTSSPTATRSVARASIAPRTGQL